MIGKRWTLRCDECAFYVDVASEALRGGEEAADILDEHMRYVHGKRFPSWRTI